MVKTASLFEVFGKKFNVTADVGLKHKLARNLVLDHRLKLDSMKCDIHELRWVFRRVEWEG